MSKRYSKIIATLIATILLSACQTSQVNNNAQSQHQISFNQQDLMLINNQQDSTGYTKIYVPAYQSGPLPTQIAVNFARGDQTPLSIAMQNLFALHNYATCQIKQHRVLNQSDSFINFSATFDQCQNGVKVVEYVKAYRTSEGQYSIIAVTDANQVYAKQINNLRDIVAQAELKPTL